MLGRADPLTCSYLVFLTKGGMTLRQEPVVTRRSWAAIQPCMGSKARILHAAD